MKLHFKGPRISNLEHNADILRQDSKSHSTGWKNASTTRVTRPVRALTGIEDGKNKASTKTHRIAQLTWVFRTIAGTMNEHTRKRRTLLPIFLSRFLFRVGAVYRPVFESSSDAVVVSLAGSSDCYVRGGGWLVVVPGFVGMFAVVVRYWLELIGRIDLKKTPLR